MKATAKELLADKLLPGKQLNQTQRKYLQDRVSKANSNRRQRPDRKKNEPANIKSARKLIGAYEAARWAVESRTRSKIETAKSAVQEKILFGTPEEALAAVQEFEKLCAVSYDD